jgi:cytochrome c oxidase subunit 2
LIDDEDNPLGLDREDKAGRDDVISEGVLYLPENRRVHLIFRSRDVLHSFFLPAQRVRQDIVPGMAIDSTFVPTKSGKFPILCTELCGIGHYAMRGNLEVMPQDEFERWMKEQTPGSHP